MTLSSLRELRPCLLAALVVLAGCATAPEPTTPSQSTAPVESTESTADQSRSTADTIEEAPAEPATTVATPVSERPNLPTIGDGVERPGGPVNRPVLPGLGGERPVWPDITASDLEGIWSLVTRSGDTQGQITLSPLDGGVSGEVVCAGTCPFADESDVRWRFFPSLGQIALLDSAGNIAWRAHRRGAESFSIYASEAGWLTLKR